VLGHDATPLAVARHLGEHGTARHVPVLVRGFRLLRGPVPGTCLQALGRLGHAGVVDLAASALKRGDLTETALGTIVETLADLGTPRARDLVREFIERKVELLADPAGMRGVLRVVAADEIPEVLSKFVTALQWRGSHRAGEAFRTLMDALQIDDAAWCFRTGPRGHIELRKTIKAVESGYDCEISSVMGKATVDRIAQRFRAGSFAEVVRALADWTRHAAHAYPAGPESDVRERISAAVAAFARQDVLDEVERMGQQVQQWLLGFQLSAAFAVARAQNFELLLKQARGDLERLLELAEVETAFFVAELPGAIAVVCRDDEEKAQVAQNHCLRLLEAQGPFFPKVVALETLGELRTVHFIPEVMDYLSDENSYVYSAAERALGKMGETIIAPAVERIVGGALDPEAAHSLLVLLCDMGTQRAYEAVTEHLDFFMNAVGPGTASEWVSLFGTEELIDPLRDWLDEDPAMVGQGLLLLGAIHNVPIPEEEEIVQAIEEARREEEGAEQPGRPDDGDPEGGSYLM
jgi:HEAT repeat protein